MEPPSVSPVTALQSLSARVTYGSGEIPESVWTFDDAGVRRVTIKLRAAVE